MIQYKQDLAQQALTEGKVTIPSLTNNDHPAGDTVELLDTLMDVGAIVVPDGLALVVINDDDVEMSGLVVQVDVKSTDWPTLSDGWSDLDNYLPHEDDEVADEAALDELAATVISRANRLVLFAEKIKRALEDA